MTVLVRKILNTQIKDDITRYIVYSRLSNIKAWRIWLEDPYLRNHKSRLLSLQGRHSGNRCFIMGNGPSINQTPLEKLADDYVWGLNRCYLLFDRIKWRPDFYIAVDTRVVPDNSSEILNVLKEEEIIAFFPIYYRIHKILSSLPNIYWYRDRPIDSSYPGGYFSTNAYDFVRQVRTVTIAAIQLAVFLGFNPIYLIGCDTTYKIPDSVEYEDSSKNYIRGTLNDDPNHFSPNYFGAGKKYHQPYPARMIKSYKNAKQVCDQLGIKIINATYGGALEVFPRIDFETLF